MAPRSLLDIAARHRLRVMAGLSAEQYIGYLIDTSKKAPGLETVVREKVCTVKGHLRCFAKKLGSAQQPGIPETTTSLWEGGGRS